jgi:HK97 family phage prohead protease
VQRLGSLEQAQQLVRSKGVVRMAERVATPRTLQPPALRSEPTDEPTMFGYFAVFNELTEIDSFFEGHFMERIDPKAFNKTFRENRDGMKVLFQHGLDPQIGDKPLGPIDELKSDEVGGYYEVPLLNAPYVRSDVLPGLEAGLYGASFRFRVMRELFDEEPDPSDTNPEGLPERTIKEAQVLEFGPVTFPAYSSATAGVRAISANSNGAENVADAPSHGDAAGEEHLPEQGSRSETDTSSTERRENEIRSWPRVSQEEWDELWIPEI